MKEPQPVQTFQGEITLKDLEESLKRPFNVNSMCHCILAVALDRICDTTVTAVSHYGGHDESYRYVVKAMMCISVLVARYDSIRTIRQKEVPQPFSDPVWDRLKNLLPFPVTIQKFPRHA